MNTHYILLATDDTILLCQEFDPDDKIVEYRAGMKVAGPLMSMSCRGFLNELSIDSPAPGGGTVAAAASASQR